VTGDEACLLGMLAADEAVHIGDLMARCEIPPARVAAALMTLELGGRARQLEGQRWIAVTARARRA
jgi:predicted Rossmann fold nucleotide-binding protein DprA/Smf involved in DNA uptake